MKSPFQRIFIYNLGVLLGAAGVLRLFIREEYTTGISGYAVLLAVLIICLSVFNITAASLTTVPGRGKIYLLAALLVLLVGFGVCGVGAQSIPRSSELPE
jgi:hypothetical protein